MNTTRRSTINVAAILPFGGCAGELLDDRELIYVAVSASDAFGVGAIPFTNGLCLRDQ